MPHYKDTANQLHWLDDAMYEYFLPLGSVQITDAEADTIRASYINTSSTEPNSKHPISALQFRMALTQMNLRSQVEDAVANGDQNLKDWYQFSIQFDRNHPQVLALETTLEVDSTQFDALWALGATL